MTKEQSLKYRVNLVLLIVTSIIISSCSGQSDKASLQSERTSLTVLPSTTDQQIVQPPDQISQVVRIVFQDSKGHLWFGTQNGAYRYRDGLLTHIGEIKSETGEGATIKAIIEDKDGNIWLGHTGGISKVTGGEVVNYYQSDGLISDDVWCLAADQEGKIWIGTIEGLCVFDGESFSIFDLPEGEIDTTLAISSTKMVHSILEDSKGVLWLSTNAGLLSYSEGVLTNMNSTIGIKTSFINEIYEDDNGSYWIATKEDLYHWDESGVRSIAADHLEIGKGIGSIEKDSKGQIWFVSNQHDLYTLDGEALTKYDKTENNKGPVVFDIFKDKEGRLWFVGYGGAYRLEDGRFVNITKDGPW